MSNHDAQFALLAIGAFIAYSALFAEDGSRAKKVLVGIGVVFALPAVLQLWLYALL